MAPREVFPWEPGLYRASGKTPSPSARAAFPRVRSKTAKATGASTSSAKSKAEARGTASYPLSPWATARSAARLARASVKGRWTRFRPVLGKGLDRTPKPTRCQNTHPLSLGQGLRLGGPGRHLLRTLLRYIPLHQSAGVQLEDHPRSSRRRSATGRLLALATGLRGRGFWPDQRTTPTWARPLRASRGSGDRGTSRPKGLPLSVTTRTLPALTKRR